MVGMTESTDPGDEGRNDGQDAPDGQEQAAEQTAQLSKREAAITVALSLIRAFVTVAAVLVFYAWLPSDGVSAGPGVLLVATATMVAWGCIVAALMFRIGKKPNALIRLASGLLSIIVLLVAAFAQLDLIVYDGDPGAYSQPLTKSAALYFSMTVTSTVGFGDIVAVSETARHLVTLQMLINMVFLAAAIKGITGAAQISHKSHPDERPKILRKHAERKAATSAGSQAE